MLIGESTSYPALTPTADDYLVFNGKAADHNEKVGARIPGKGASYQEDFTGVPYGMEINIGVQITEGGIKELLDLKDWQGWPVAEGEKWWGRNNRNEARRQESVAALVGARAVWIVRDPAKADMVREHFRGQGVGVEGVEVRLDVR